MVNNTNKNDTRRLLGPPSTKSTFDTDLWVYIERKTSSSRLTKLGKKKLLVNNVLVIEFNTRGLLIKKTLLTKDNMEKCRKAFEHVRASISQELKEHAMTRKQKKERIEQLMSIVSNVQSSSDDIGEDWEYELELAEKLMDHLER